MLKVAAIWTLKVKQIPVSAWTARKAELWPKRQSLRIVIEHKAGTERRNHQHKRQQTDPQQQTLR
jgi:hypothetical protein